ncbi:MAG: FtsX-like permease family protein, partial [Rhodothermales bacterium]|nr:FtsX-like permease family protein [Rhodothermales bacterium]
QESLERNGLLSRIDVVLSDDPTAETRLRAELPTGAVLETAESRTETLAQMTRAFDVNLRALSLLALVVGMFLIYNSMTFSVVQRRPLIGRLRALGMTRSQIFGLIIGEATVMGIAGTVGGIALGILLASGLLDLVTRTINDLYFVVTVRRLEIEVLTLLKGLGIGVGVTVLAAVRPAWEATAVPVTVVLQRSAVEEVSHRLAYRFALMSVAALLLAAVILVTAQSSIVWSYAGLLLVIIGFVLAAPAGVLLMSRILRPVLSSLFGVVGRMASNAVGAGLSRTGIAISALMVAVAATIGVGIMISSFRSTVSDWLTYSLQADIYIRPPSLVIRRGDAIISPDVVDIVRDTPGLSEVYTVAHGPVRSELGDVDAVIIEPGPMTPETFRLTGRRLGDIEWTWQKVSTTPAVLVSEPFSFRYERAAGDTISLETPSGTRDFVIAGVYLDYGSDLGAILFTKEVFEDHFDYPGTAGIALYLDSDVESDVVIREVAARTRDLQDLSIQSNRELREASLEVFDRTFVVTGVLRFLAVFVAFVGVLSALMALQLEKTRELAVLRATGATPAQVWRYVTAQTGIMGLIAGILSVPLGLALAALLVFIINKRSFGWTLQFEPSFGVLLGAVALSLVAALLAGLYPSWKMAGTDPSEAMRQE